MRAHRPKVVDAHLKLQQAIFLDAVQMQLTQQLVLPRL